MSERVTVSDGFRTCCPGDPHRKCPFQARSVCLLRGIGNSRPRYCPDCDCADDRECLLPDQRRPRRTRKTQNSMVSGVSGWQHENRGGERAGHRRTRRRKKSSDGGERKSGGEQSDQKSARYARPTLVCGKAQCRAYKERKRMNAEREQKPGQISERNGADDYQAEHGGLRMRGEWLRLPPPPWRDL